jgi:hypothetical protein
MNEFEDRWMKGAEAARRATSAASEEAPFGFATRVIAQWQSQPEASLNLLWQRLAMRVLGAMAIILLSLATYDALSMGDNSVEPPVENAVGDSLGLL